MKDKYDELRAAIAAVRRVNADFLEILPARRGECGDAEKGCRRGDDSTVKDTVAAFFRDHGQEAEEAIAAFLDARAVFLRWVSAQLAGGVLHGALLAADYVAAPSATLP